MLRRAAAGLSFIVVAAALACGSSSSEFYDGTSSSSGNSSGDNTAEFMSSDAPDSGGDGSSSGASGGPSCATAEAATTREPVYLDIILDGSRSMDGHGSIAAGCDSNAGPLVSTSTCFVANAREKDPRDEHRTLKVCHEEGDTVDKCPESEGMTGKKWIAIREALLAFFDSARDKADTRLGLGMYLFRSEIIKPSDA